MNALIVNLIGLLFLASLCVIGLVLNAPTVRRLREKTGDDSFVTALLSGEIFSRRQAARRKNG